MTILFRTRCINQKRKGQIHWKILEHLDYSEGRPQCDNHMFGPLKAELGSHAFNYDEDVENFLRNWSQMRLDSFFDDGIKKNV